MGSQPSVATVSLTFPNITARQVAVQNIILENVPQGYEAELVNQQLYVWVRGNSDLVADLDPGQLQVEVDLSNASTGNGLQRFAATVTFKGDNPEAWGSWGPNTASRCVCTRHPKRKDNGEGGFTKWNKWQL